MRTGHCIRGIIDFTYPPFRKLISAQLYRYGVCGGANVVFDWVLYFLVYNFAIQYRDVGLGIVTLSPHIATLVMIFPVVTFSGFLLQKYVTFTASDLRGSTQLVRYLMIVFANLLINYIGLKVFVDGLDFYPTPSKMIITLITVVCSYTGQKRFTFKSSSLVNKIQEDDKKSPQEPPG
jgi:putative flippase GtrA